MQRLLLALVVIGASAGAAAAQSAQPNRPSPECPPETRHTTPGTATDSGATLTEKLAVSKGVICPPAGVDPEIKVAPPEGGALKVVPPPDSPGGNPRVQPK